MLFPPRTSNNVIYPSSFLVQKLPLFLLTEISLVKIFFFHLQKLEACVNNEDTMVYTVVYRGEGLIEGGEMVHLPVYLFLFPLTSIRNGGSVRVNH
jgi:hypothetical protein